MRWSMGSVGCSAEADPSQLKLLSAQGVESEGTRYSQILRSSFGPLDLVGLSFSMYCGSRIVRANTGALVPPLGALFLLLSMFVAMVDVLCLQCCESL